MRVGVDRKNDCHIVTRSDGGNRFGNRLHPFAEILAAVRGDGDDTLARKAANERI